MAFGSLVQLDGSGSADSDHQALTYSWSFATMPAGSAAVLSQTNSAGPTFVADKVGNYVVQLIVNDGYLSSPPATVTITTLNAAPIANAGKAQAVNQGDTVTLDGSSSYDPDGESLTYQWSLTSPAGTSVTLSDATAVKPTFVASVAGTHVFQLTVSDGSASSNPPATVMISVNAPPVVNAGPNQTIELPVNTASLQGSVTDDGLPVGGSLTSKWSVDPTSTGSGTVSFADASSPKTDATFSAAGTYVLRLTGNDSQLNSYATVTITVLPVNQPPVVSAGPNQTILLPLNVVTLTGNATDDGLPNGTLTKSWSVATLPPPPGPVTFSNPSSEVTQASFTAPGVYDLVLTADDSELSTSSDVYVTVLQNQPPVVSAGPNQTITLPTNSVTLNGTATDDGLPNGSLTITWTAPAGVTFSNPNSAVTQATLPGQGTFVLTLTANDSLLQTSSSVTITVANHVPTANAGAAQTVHSPGTVQLDGSGSTDVDGDALTYTWSFESVPDGSQATLSNANIVNPTFVTDLKGDYKLKLVVNDGQQDSPDTPASHVIISFVNSAPVANAGPDQALNVGTLVQLDGSHSTDVDGDTLTYKWTLSAPAGSATTLSDPTAPQPTFIPDMLGTYQAQLIVNDGIVDSQPATATITSNDLPPVAVPGPDQTVPFGATVNLDGSHSTDSDNRPLSYRWSLLSKPANSAAALSGADIATPSFITDIGGLYIVQLIVNDGFSDSVPKTVRISTINVPPVAVPGPDQTVNAGTTVQLNGSGSRDVDGDPITYRWALLNEPSGSSAALQNANTAMPTFVPDLAGLYVVQLIVNDGTVDGDPKTLTVTAVNPNKPPVVNAGPNQTVLFPANTATLSGTATDDGLPNGTLLISWTEVNGPAAVTFSSANSATTQATFSALGTYQLRLTANDSQLQTSSDVFVYVVQNQPPVVSAGPNLTIQLPTNAVSLQGTVTDDGLPNGTLTSMWSELAGPAPVSFASPNQAVTQATFSQAGVYLLQLSASDSLLTSESTVTITVQSAGGGNLAPTVNAGPNRSIVLPTNTLTLNGYVADDGLPNGTLRTSWSQVSGPVSVLFNTPNQASTQVTFNATGTYHLRLSASDSQFTTTSDVVVEVFSSNGGQNQAPYVSAGADQTVILPGSAVLNGVAVDDGLPNGTLSIGWQKISGPASVTFTNPNSAATNAVFASAGTYVLRLSASDSQLASSSDVTVHVLSLQGARSNKGTDFWLMFPTNDTGGNPSELDLYIAADTATSGTVTVPGIAFSKNFAANAGGVTTVTVPQTAMSANPDVVENKGIHITSQLPVGVYGMSLMQYSVDGYLGLPTTMLGTQYMAVAFQNEAICSSSCIPTQYGSQFSVVAPFDSTNVTITPSIDTEGHPAGVPYTIVLDQGHTYEMQNTTTQDGDLTGSLITSDKPISVFSGHWCANVGDAAACNQLVENVPPIENWGETFAVVPFATRLNGDLVRVVGSVDGTLVSLNGVPTATVNRGSYFEFSLLQPTEITTDQPVLVAQYAHSIGFDSNTATNGDPTLVVIQPIEQFGSNYTVTTPATEFTINYLNIIVSSTAASSVMLDGNPIPASAFTPIGQGAFSGAQIAVAVGPHNVSSPTPIGVTVYGFAHFDAYSYPAGQSLGTVPNASIALEPKTFTQQTGTQHCAVATVRDSFGGPMGGITATFVVSGANFATGLATTDFSGHAEYCYSGIKSGNDSVTAAIGDTRDSATVTWDPNAGNQAPFLDAGSPQTVTFPAAITLAGIVTDDGLPAGSSNNIQWTQASGPGTVSFVPSTSAYTTASFSAPGTYVLQLGASDSQLSNTSNVTITVNALPQNQPPTANAGPNQTLQLGQSTDGTVTLTGTASDDGLPAGSQLMLTWSYVSCMAPPANGCTTPTILNPQSAVTKVYFPPLQTVPGVYTFKLTADDTQLTASSTVTVTVLAANQPPRISLAVSPGNQTITLPTNTMTVTGTVTDDGLPAGAPVTSSWSQTGGPAAVTFSNPNSPSTQITFPVPGTYYVVLSATDTQYTATQSLQLFVHQANQPPSITVSASPNNISLPSNMVTLAASVTDDGKPSGTINVTWTQIAGPAPATLATPNATSTQATFSVPGSYGFTGTANDTQLSTSANVFVTVNPQNQAPQVNAGPNQTVALPSNTVTLSGSATDDGLPAGSHLTVSWSVFSGPGTVTFSAPSSVTTQATFSSAGTYELRLSANDTQYTSFADCIATVYPAPQNQPPKVFAGLNQSVTLPNPRNGTFATLFLQGTVTDDGLPTGSHVTQSWSVLSGPATPNIYTPTGTTTRVDFTVAGTYVFQLTASDTQLTSSSTVTVVVNPPVNQAPSVSTAGVLSVTLPASATLAATINDDGLPTGSTVAVQWMQQSGPTAAMIAAPNQASTQATFSAPGNYVFLVSANDTQLSSTAYLTVVVQPANQPPAVSAGPAQTIQLPVNTVTLSGSASDDGLPLGSTLSYQWVQTLGPAQAIIANPNSLSTQVTLPGTGNFFSSYTFQLIVSDGQLSTSSSVTINVDPPSNPPTVQLLGPADGDEITGPVQIKGNIFPEVTSYSLDYSLNVGDGPGATWVNFGGYGHDYNSSVLGTFDPSTLLNGTYTLRLTATNKYGQSASTSVVVNVTRNRKIGVLTLSYNDLTVPVAGLPIQIIRTYDSRDRSAHDFGRGWTLSIANVRLQKNRPLGRNWIETYDGTSFFPKNCLQPENDRIVTITFPDNKVYRFLAGSKPLCQVAGPIVAPTVTFEQLSGSAGTAGATLVPADGGQVLLDGAVPGPVNLIDYSSNPYNPTVFILTTADGTQYTIDQTLGVTKMVDANGNTLTISSSGITSSSGKSVVFKRNSGGQITEIDDPDNNKILYSYNGDVLGSVTDAAGRTTNLYWDYQGNQLATILPPGSNFVRFNYDGSGRPLSTSDPVAGSVSYGYDTANNRENITDRNNNVTTYEYDTDGNVISVTDALGHTTTSTYDSNDNKLTDTNALGKTTTYTYDGLGNRTTETDPLGNVTTYAYNARKQVVSVTDALGRTTSNIYDNNGNLLTTTDAVGNVTTYTYTGNGLPQTVTDALNHTTTFAYDNAGRLTSQTDALNNVAGYTYDSNGNKLTQTVTRTLANGTKQTLTTTYTYDGDNRLTKTLYPDNSYTTVQYNSLGKQSDTYDQLQHHTHYDYDADGRLTKTTYPDNTTEVTTYDNEGHRKTFTDRNSHLTTYNYDSVYHLTSTVYVDGTSTSTVYDAAGQVTSSKDANGNATQYVYDDAGRRTQTIDALNHTTVFGYDSAGQQTSVIDANQHKTQYVYDNAGRRTQTIYPDQTTETVGYDALGRMTSKTDQAGKVTNYGYDPLGRLTSVTQFLNGNPLVTSYGYDEVGNRISQTDANNHTTSYAYDQLGRRVGRTLPLGQSESYTYDAAGNLKTRTDFNGHTTTYNYDAMNRLLSKTADSYFSTGNCAGGACGATSVSFTYTNSGQRKTMADASGSTTYSYDQRDRLQSKQTPEGTLSYTYDSGNDVLSINSSNTSGASMAYTYDKLNRLSTVTDIAGVTNYSYDPAGNLAGFSYPNGVSHSYTYDTLNRLTNLNVGPANTCGTAAPGCVGSYAYTLGVAGNRTSVTELSGRAVQYGYDDLYRLTSETIAGATSQNGTISYTYDSVGNRKQITSTVQAIPSSGTLFYDANDRTMTDSYDNDGNTVASGGIANVYDFENHLVQHGSVAIIYDGDGNRVAETANGMTTKYLVDTLNATGYAQVLDELKGGTVARTYTWGLTLLSKLEISASLRSFYGFDGHGNVRSLTDTTGAVTDTYDYDAFGNLLASTGSTPNKYLFAGEQFDSDLGLYYNRARYLDVRAGRFWGMDSFEGDPESPGSLHKYLYTSNDPVNHSDRSGNDEADIGSVSVAAAGEVTVFGLSALQSQAVIGTVIGAGFGAFTGALGGYLAGNNPDQIEDATQRGILVGALYGLVGGYAQVFRVTRILFQFIGYGLGGAASLDELKKGHYGTAVVYAIGTFGIPAILSVARVAADVVTPELDPVAPADRVTNSRSTLDIGVNPNPPRALPTNRSISNSPVQNSLLQRFIAQLQALGAQDIRVNQQQVSAEGVRVGINRPDLQYTLNGERYYVEFDSDLDSGFAHRARILSNDPNGNVTHVIIY